MTTWLIGKSALVRLTGSPDADDWAGRIEQGRVRITTVTRWRSATPPARSGPADWAMPASGAGNAGGVPGLTVLHCDKDFDLIAAFTGQPAERLTVQ